MANPKEIVYNAHSKAIFSLTVLEGGVAVDLVANGATRMVVKLTSKEGPSREKILDSGVNASYFDWLTRGASGIADFKFGGAALREGIYEAYLVIYDPQHDTGQPWPPFTVEVIDVIE